LCATKGEKNMRNDEISNYVLVFLSVITFGVLGLFTLGVVGLIAGLSVGLIVGLLFSILNYVERVFNILYGKTQSKNDN
jgi:hypothetical protein